MESEPEERCETECHTKDSSLTPKKRKKIVVVVSSPAEVESICQVKETSDRSPQPSTDSACNDVSELPPPEKRPTVKSSPREPDSDDDLWSPRHDPTNASKKHFKCRLCGRRYLRKNDLTKHQVTKHNMFPYACDEKGCLERFETISELKKHANIHNPDAVKTCHICRRVFTSSGALKVHMRTHCPVPYKCDECSSIFSRAVDLIVHRRFLHPSSKPKILSPKEMEEVELLLAKLPAIMPKPAAPIKLAGKLPLPRKRRHPGSRPPSDRQKLRPILPNSLLNSFPPENFVPIYDSRPQSVAPGAEVPATNTFYQPMIFQQENYSNGFQMDSSHYLPPPNQADFDQSANTGFPVDLDAHFSMTPTEIVDLNAYPEVPVDVQDMSELYWMNSNPYTPDQNQNWLQPISLFSDSQSDTEMMQLVNEAFQDDSGFNI